MNVFLFEQIGYVKNFQEDMPEQIMIEADYAHEANAIAQQLDANFEDFTWQLVEQADGYETRTDALIANGNIKVNKLLHNLYETQLGIGVGDDKVIPLAWIHVKPSTSEFFEKTWPLIGL